MNRLKTIREINKISQEELAKVLKTSQRQISLYETEKRELKESQIEIVYKHYRINAKWF